MKAKSFEISRKVVIEAWKQVKANKAGKAMRQKSRRWNLHLRSDLCLEDLSRIVSPIIQGLYTLLRKLLQICAVPDPEPPEYNTGQMGKEEIQEVEAPFHQCDILVRGSLQKAALIISALADGYTR